MQIKFKKIVVLFLVFTFVFSPVFAIPAQAQWVVWDPGNFVPNSVTAVNTTVVAGAQVANTTKEYGLDAVFNILAKLIIQRMAASTVKWINSGFKGSPAFVTDPEAYFQNIGDQVAGQFIFNNPDLNFLCGPISAKIKLALANNYAGNNQQQWKCTLTQVGKNMDNFMSSFDNGGWDSFFQVSQKQQNNPIGAYLQAEGSLAQQIATKTGLKKDDLTQGKGFMSYQECTEYKPADPNCANCSSEPVCVKEKTLTPGSVVADQLNKTLGAGTDALVTADEMNEIVSALLTQLMSQVMGGIGGLLGASTPSLTSGGQTLTSQMANISIASTTDYFGSTTVDTSILDKPVPDFNYDLNAGKPSGNSNYFSANCAVNPSLPECLP
jgi:hypothetical protein